MEKKGKAWTKRDLRTVKRMSREGISNAEIAKVLGRTPGSVGFQKSVMGIRVRKKRVGVPVAEGVKETKGVSVRGRAKDMTRIARDIARSNGRRITMALFFVEEI
jgi:hypothetical protein